MVNNMGMFEVVLLAASVPFLTQAMLHVHVKTILIKGLKKHMRTFEAFLNEASNLIMNICPSINIHVLYMYMYKDSMILHVLTSKTSSLIRWKDQELTIRIKP